jgi:hypothetical protein
MDPTNLQPDNSQSMEKLETDLKSLEKTPLDASDTIQSGQSTNLPAEALAQEGQPFVQSTQLPESKKSSHLMIIAIILAVIAVIAVAVYVIGMKYFPSKSKQVACTLEAKICPDGSSVGRTGPNCEFAACPIVAPTPIATVDPTANWKTYTDDHFVLKYLNDYTAVSVAFVTSPEYSSGNSINFRNTTDSITITDSPNSQNLTVANALGSGPWVRYTQDFLTGKTIQKFSIDGVEGVGVENIAAGQSGIALDVIWINKGMIYQASTTSNGGSMVLKQILSTFKFIEATPSGSPTSSPASL